MAPPACRAPLRQGRRVGEHRTPDSTSSSEPAAGGLARAIEPWIHSGHSQESSGCPQCPAPRCGVLQGSPSQAPPADRLPAFPRCNPCRSQFGATHRQPISAPPTLKGKARSEKNSIREEVSRVHGSIAGRIAEEDTLKGLVLCPQSVRTPGASNTCPAATPSSNSVALIPSGCCSHTDSGTGIIATPAVSNLPEY